MVFTTEELFEVAIESWPEWYLNPRSLNSIHMLYLTELSGHEFNSHLPNFVQLLQFHYFFSVTFHFGYCFSQSPRLFELQISCGTHMSVSEWADRYGKHHWRIFCTSYRKLVRVRSEPTNTEFRSDARTDWNIRQWVQVAHRQHCAASPISFPVQCHIPFCLLSSSVAMIPQFPIVFLVFHFNGRFLELITWV